MKYIKFLSITIIMSAVLFQAIVCGIICEPKNVFDSSYQSVIQDKFRILQSTNDPKIIVVAGSNAAFGLNQKMLASATGYKVVNLGLHAGFGHLFYSELAKANINKGDIVLLGYEYGWQDEDGFRNLGADLIMSGIDDNISMYRYIPIDKWSIFLGYLFTYANTKNAYQPVTGQYSRDAFDSATGQMTFIRDYTMEYDAEQYGTVDISNVTISSQSIHYLKNFKKYVESKGASVYFIAPPLLIDSVTCNYDEFEKLKVLEEENIGIKYISDPVQYLYPAKLMSNSLYHCNTAGESVRTQMLIDDLVNADVIPAQTQ